MISKLQAGKILLTLVLILIPILIFYFRKHRQKIVAGDVCILRSSFSSQLVVILHHGEDAVSYVNEQNVGMGMKHIKTDDHYIFYTIMHPIRLSRNPNFTKEYSILNLPINVLSKFKTTKAK